MYLKKFSARADGKLNFVAGLVSSATRLQSVSARRADLE
jgi:hypothetical protein